MESLIMINLMTVFVVVVVGAVIWPLWIRPRWRDYRLRRFLRNHPHVKLVIQPQPQQHTSSPFDSSFFISRIMPLLIFLFQRIAVAVALLQPLHVWLYHTIFIPCTSWMVSILQRICTFLLHAGSCLIQSIGIVHPTPAAVSATDPSTTATPDQPIATGKKFPSSITTTTTTSILKKKKHAQHRRSVGFSESPGGRVAQQVHYYPRETIESTSHHTRPSFTNASSSFATKDTAVISTPVVHHHTSPRISSSASLGPDPKVSQTTTRQHPKLVQHLSSQRRRTMNNSNNNNNNSTSVLKLKRQSWNPDPNHEHHHSEEETPHLQHPRKKLLLTATSYHSATQPVHHHHHHRKRFLSSILYNQYQQQQQNGYPVRIQTPYGKKKKVKWTTTTNESWSSDVPTQTRTSAAAAIDSTETHPSTMTTTTPTSEATLFSKNNTPKSSSTMTTLPTFLTTAAESNTAPMSSSSPSSEHGNPSNNTSNSATAKMTTNCTDTSTAPSKELSFSSSSSPSLIGSAAGTSTVPMGGSTPSNTAAAALTSNGALSAPSATFQFCGSTASTVTNPSTNTNQPSSSSNTNPSTTSTVNPLGGSGMPMATVSNVTSSAPSGTFQFGGSTVATVTNPSTNTSQPSNSSNTNPSTFAAAKPVGVSGMPMATVSNVASSAPSGTFQFGGSTAAPVTIPATNTNSGSSNNNTSSNHMNGSSSIASFGGFDSAVPTGTPQNPFINSTNNQHPTTSPAFTAPVNPPWFGVSTSENASTVMNQNIYKFEGGGVAFGMATNNNSSGGSLSFGTSSTMGTSSRRPMRRRR